MSTAAEDFELLGLTPSASEAEVRRAYRHAAMTTHPDSEGGSEEKMKALNAAYERCLESVSNREDPKCVCFGFTRSPLCHAHEEPPKGDGQCSECGGTKRVEVGSPWSKVFMDCPKCN